MSIHIRSSSATLFFASSAPHRALASFPTRRSSDLTPCDAGGDSGPALRGRDFLLRRRRRKSRPRSAGPESRSEEHTSELQSHSDLVCRLLLEKKKKTYTKFTSYALTTNT